MPSINPRIDRLKAMLGLEEKRATLQRELDALHMQISSLQDQLFDESAPSTPAKASPKPVAASSGRSERGALKEQILAALSSAGAAGVRVTELAATLGTKAANIHAWFHSTGKRVPGLTKVSGGHYRMKESASAASKPASAPAQTTPSAPKAPAKKSSKGKKAKGTRRGELSNNILAALEAAGDEGMKIKELADKVGANYRNVSVWFVTTGKNYPKVTKVAAAHYKLVA